ncbi:MAG: MotA/TolQ/ExbB proton channel family protein [Deltaproteobacteria bacterium]|nr:MotA/TolQ/ExbB proton channel family protein [Deltaproteobacteria bacterium]MBN2670148.1 MotA/TolQ/ExbB proton channel family protein [Deltaproteobacteria bacterium]
MYSHVANILDPLSALVAAGGSVMWPLLIVGVLVWTLLLLRVMTLWEVKAALRRNEVCSEMTAEYFSTELRLRLWKLALRRHGPIVDTLVAAAPLLGLLGTVSGMITTFEGLTSMTLFSESGGIAGGISEALTTTQAGLLVAIPAFFANRVVGRKVTKLEQQLDGVLLAPAPLISRCTP